MVYRLTIKYVFTPNVGWPQPYRRSPIKLSGTLNLSSYVGKTTHQSAMYDY